MPSINIPDEELPKLKEIVELSNERFDSLVSALSETGPTLTPVQFESEVEKRLPSFSEDEILRILPTVFGLYWLKDRFNLPAEELAKGIKDTLIEESPKEFSKEKAEVLKSRLSALLGFDKTIG